MSELQTLKNALIDDAAHIEVVLNIHGALKGIVREMTGQEVNKQCAAVGCCCNLALGDTRAGVAIVKAAGPYLVATLDSLTTELAVTSAWTLGNLAGCCPKACEVLTAQGAMTKLIELWECNNEEIKDAALYALVRFTYQLKDDLRTEHLHNIFKILHRLDENSTQLLFILSCHEHFTSDLLSKELLTNLLQYLIVNLQQNNNEIVTNIFRFLANVNSREVFIVALNFLIENNIVITIKKLVEIDESVLWFLGNAFNLSKDHIFFEMLVRL